MPSASGVMARAITPLSASMTAASIIGRPSISCCSSRFVASASRTPSTPRPCNGPEIAAMSRRISSSRARRTGSPIVRAASYDALRGLHDEVRQVDDQKRQDDRHDQGRRDGEHAEHQHQAHVQARAGGAAPAIQPELRQPHREKRHQRHGDHEIGHQEAGDPAAGVEGERREARQPGIGGRAGEHGEHGQRHGRGAAAQPAADRAHRIAQA